MAIKPWNLPENRNKLKALRALEAKCKREGRMNQNQWIEILNLKEAIGITPSAKYPRDIKPKQ